MTARTVRIVWQVTENDQNIYASEFSVAPTGALNLTLSPAAAINLVGTTHTVTATVTDSLSSPVANMSVLFTVTGSVNISGSCTTGANGQCTFTYQGPQLPGNDLIDAFADQNGNGVWDGGFCTHLPCLQEARSQATKTWVLPSSTSGSAFGGGRLNLPGPPYLFSFNAMSNGGTASGTCHVRVLFRPFEITCTDVNVFVRNGNEATFYGDALQNGAPTTYVIHVVGNSNPGTGVPDSFFIETAAGESASGTLAAGNIVVTP